MEQQSYIDIMDNREGDIQQLDASFVELKDNFDNQISVLTQENKDLGAKYN